MTTFIALAAFTLGVLVDQLVTVFGAAYEDARARKAPRADDPPG